ncbi:AP2/ERF family transcription factor [Ideonella dechloratans]|uniref:AP2/ERF family transcription factor n=1 Tax=Ideonella dechloratans TaxID=36863 RepID=UPI0035AED722
MPPQRRSEDHDTFQSPKDSHFGIKRSSLSQLWEVRLYRRGVTHRRCFSAARYGDMDQALAAALAWRDARLAELAPFTEQELCMRQRGNNTSGTPGVTLMTVRRKRADGHVAEEQHWVARLERQGQRRQAKRFSVARYGYERAYELAVQARLAMVATVTGLRLCQTPEQLKPASDARLTVQEQPLPTRPRGGRGVRLD